MLFCSAPRRTDTVHRTNAPVVPSAPIEAPSAAITNPGLASSTTKPSHQVIALRSCRSSTTAVANAFSSPSELCDWTNLSGAPRFYQPRRTWSTKVWSDGQRRCEPVELGRGLDLFVQRDRRMRMSEKQWAGEPYFGLGYDWDPDWLLTDRQLELRELLIGRCEKEVRPHAKASDDRLEFPRRNLELLGEHGFLGLTVPEEYGGLREKPVGFSMGCGEIPGPGGGVGGV